MLTISLVLIATKSRHGAVSSLLILPTAEMFRSETARSAFDEVSQTRFVFLSASPVAVG